MFVSRSLASPFAEEFSRTIKLLNAMIATICHVDISVFIYGYSKRLIELSVSGSLASPCEQKLLTERGCGTEHHQKHHTHERFRQKLEQLRHGLLLFPTGRIYCCHKILLLSVSLTPSRVQGPGSNAEYSPL